MKHRSIVCSRVNNTTLYRKNSTKIRLAEAEPQELTLDRPLSWHREPQRSFDSEHWTTYDLRLELCSLKRQRQSGRYSGCICRLPRLRDGSHYLKDLHMLCNGRTYYSVFPNYHSHIYQLVRPRYFFWAGRCEFSSHQTSCGCAASELNTGTVRL